MSILDINVNSALVSSILGLNSMNKTLQNALPIAEGIAKLFHPLAEVVLHDLKSDSIKAIFNPLSRREVGDPSYLDRLDFNDAKPVVGPYEKLNWDGRKLKSVSIVLRNGCNIAEGFICINIDVSHFSSIHALLGQFIGNNALMSDEEQKLFKDDLYEQINYFVQSYCREEQVAVEALSRTNKQSIISKLQSQGAFQGRNAATYVARILGVSRATVYNYLKVDGDQ